MRARWQGRVIAESDEAVEVGGYTYFPRTAVRMEWLSAAEKTSRDLACPHGVRFYDVSDGALRSERAAWSYEAPQPAMARVDHWIGFWEDVEIEPRG